MNLPSQKKKILFVITKSNFGGAQKYVYDIARSLSKNRFDVAVAVGGSGLLIKKLQGKDIRTLPILSLTRDVNTKSDTTAFFELLRIFRTEKPDVVHLNSAKAGGVGALAARIAGVPRIIFTAHGWAFNEDRPFYQRIIIKFFSWLTILLSHKTIAVSDAVRKNAGRWPFVDDKIVVIKNGITKPDFYTKEEARTQLCSKANITIPEDSFIIGTIAELHKNKGLQYAIEAFAKLAPSNPLLYYFILGGGEEQEHLQNLIKQCGLGRRVVLMGFTEDAARFLPAFDMFVLSSITEGLALVLLEAGLAGLPVVATHVGGIPEIITNEETGLLVPPRDSNALSQAIKEIITNKSRAKRLGEALHERTDTEFSLARVITETSALYTGK